MQGVPSPRPERYVLVQTELLWERELQRRVEILMQDLHP